MSSTIEIFSNINTMQKHAIDQHNEWSDMFDFIGLHGFKRLHHYRATCETEMNRKLNKWFINHKQRILPVSPDKIHSVIPSKWFDTSSVDVTERDVVENSKFLFDQYEKSLVSELSMYDNACRHVMETDSEAGLKLTCYLEYVSKELKICRRMMQKMRSSAYSSVMIVMLQDKIHDHYKIKIKR